MAKQKIQNLYLETDLPAGAEIVDFYHNTTGGSKGVRIRDLVYVGWAIRKISPTLCQVISSMIEENAPLDAEKLKMLIAVCDHSGEKNSQTKPIESTKEEKKLPVKPEPEGGVFSLGKWPQRDIKPW